MARIYLFMVVLFATIMSCKPKHEETKTEDSVTTTSSAPVDSAAHPRLNQPTPQQSADGYVSLFDGKTMNGWEVYKKKENDSWEVADDALHCKPFNDNGTNKRADIRTTTEYENFDLLFDFRISPQGNSGVMFRVNEKYDEPYASGPEYQVIDDKGYPGDLKDVQHTAANYDMQIADANKPLNPAGEWNTGRIVANGKHVEHWLNGTKVLEYDLGSDDWKKRLKNSKWKDFPGYGLTPKGYIDLQDHGNEVWFRNIFIKTL